MGKLTKQEHKTLKDLVIDCKLKKLSEEQSLAYIASKFGGITISSTTLYNIKNELKEDAQAQITLLKREEFVLEAHERVDELKANYRELMALKEKAGRIKGLVDRVRALHDIEMSLSTLTIRISEMYDALPFVAAVQTKLKKEEEQEHGAPVPEPA